MNIFFDLDGTLIDSKTRLYRLFSDLVPEINLSFEEYWDLKKEQINHKSIILDLFKLDEAFYYRFSQNWMKNIESPNYLSFDEPFAGTESFLFTLAENHCLVLVTHRQYPEMVYRELERFNLLAPFKMILVSQQKTDKKTLIQENIRVTENDWIVGDTGIDIQCGKELRIKTAAVLSGFLSETQLKKYNPDLIGNFVTDLNFNNWNQKD